MDEEDVPVAGLPNGASVPDHEPAQAGAGENRAHQFWQFLFEEDAENISGGVLLHYNGRCHSSSGLSRIRLHLHDVLCGAASTVDSGASLVTER